MAEEKTAPIMSRVEDAYGARVRRALLNFLYIDDMQKGAFIRMCRRNMNERYETKDKEVLEDVEKLFGSYARDFIVCFNNMSIPNQKIFLASLIIEANSIYGAGKE